MPKNKATQTIFSLVEFILVVLVPLNFGYRGSGEDRTGCIDAKSVK